MNNNILKEFIHSIDKDIDIQYTYNYSSNMFDKIIYIGLGDRDIQNHLMDYIKLDMGYNYYKYCSSTVWSILHELGHILTASDKDVLEVEFNRYNKDIESIIKSNVSPYEKIKRYMLLPLEKKANDWAYEYLLNNKDKIKRLEKEMLKK